MCMLKYLLIKPKNIFECFICFWKWFYTFVQCIFVFFFKNWFRGLFARSSWLKASREMCLREIKKSHFHTESLATSSQISVNGESQSLIHPSRGIRQGDLFSPFLFLLCTKGLHEIVKKAEIDGELKGFSICRQDLKLIHLFFTNDNSLFCRDNSEECGNILC